MKNAIMVIMVIGLSVLGTLNFQTQKKLTALKAQDKELLKQLAEFAVTVSTYKVGHDMTHKLMSETTNMILDAVIEMKNEKPTRNVIAL